MRSRIIIGALLGLFLFTGTSMAQDDERAIKEAVMTMFNGMRAGDSAMVHSVFSDEVVFQRVQENREGKAIVVTSKFSDFLKAVGTPHEEIWDERIEFGTIEIDGKMASVWTPFKFYRGSQFSHCGVNVFKLYKSEAGWKIFHLVDTNRGTNCK